MRKILALLLAMLMTLSLAACSRQEKYTSDDSSNESGDHYDDILKNEDKENEDKSKIGNKDDNAVVLVKANTGLINEDLIPDGYSMDLVPILSGSEIYSGEKGEYKSQPKYRLLCLSEEKFNSVVSFYRGAMKDYGLEEMVGEGGMTLQGLYENAQIGITIKDEKGGHTFKKKYLTSFEISMMFLSDETMQQLKEN